MLMNKFNPKNKINNKEYLIQNHNCLLDSPTLNPVSS